MCFAVCTVVCTMCYITFDLFIIYTGFSINQKKEDLLLTSCQDDSGGPPSWGLEDRGAQRAGLTKVTISNKLSSVLRLLTLGVCHTLRICGLGVHAGNRGEH